MRKIVLILLMLPWCCGAEGLVGEVVSPVWSHLQIIFEYGGMPAVILLFGWMYLRSVNSKWSSLIEKMQSQFMQQQHIMQEQFIQQQQMLLVVVQNNTAMLSTLSTKLGMGCVNHPSPKGGGLVTAVTIKG